MKMMQGAFCLACSNRSRTREAPTPTNISTKSEPEIEKKGTPASPATARASSVLPVPGGPNRSTNGSSEVKNAIHDHEPVPFESKVTLYFSNSVVSCGADWSLG